MNSANRTIAILLFLFALSAHGAKAPPFSLSRLQAAYKNPGSIEADFQQEVFQASLARTKTSKGNLRLSKPDFVRWEIFEPEASVMVSDGRKVSYFTPDARGKGKGQVIERKAAELKNQPLFRILTGQAALSQEFTLLGREVVAGAQSGEKATELKLQPKKPMADLATLKLRVGPKYLIEEIILENKSGNKTKITLHNQALGDKLPPALFQFKAPEGTEIVRQ